jgi:hypothetical protein
MPLPTLLRHAVAIADALEKAHASGVIHRDLNPGGLCCLQTSPMLPIPLETN